MPRYEFVQGTSSKFWEIDRAGNEVTVCYGKIGTSGTSKTKAYADEAAAQKDMDKQITSKTKKGYQLAGEGGGDGAASGGAQPLIGLEKESEWGYENASHFVFRTVVDYKPGKPGLSQAAKGVAYRIRFDYDDGGPDEYVARLQQLAADKHASKLEALVLGAWGGEETATGEGGDQVIQGVLALKDACPNLKAIFLGDITQEECEVSWIQHGDWAPLIAAFPQLEHFRVRGNADAGAFHSDTLRSLCVQSMTSQRTAQSVATANLPELEHLELWLGTDEYGGDATVADLLPILSGKQFPKLRYLGLRNAQLANDVAEAVATSPILERIKVLDLSLGVMNDRGANALLASPAAAKLEKLDLHYNFISPDVAKKLKSLGPDVNTTRGDATDMDGEDEEYRYVAVGE